MMSHAFVLFAPLLCLHSCAVRAQLAPAQYAALSAALHAHSLAPPFGPREPCLSTARVRIDCHNGYVTDLEIDAS